MYLKDLTVDGFKSFSKKTTLTFPTRITAIVGPNGSGKSNVAEAFRFVLGEQSIKVLRGKRGEDLIFNGGTGVSAARQASVSITFNNAKKMLHDAFSEVTIQRSVQRNGTNEYQINGTQVKHGDIVELLAKANIGATGHHIISQGEADRILNATEEERKEMIEDGLGLKLLQYRKTEAEKKLQKAKQHIAETESLQRELAPQLRYLKKQVEKYEKAAHLKVELKEIYKTYLAKEETYITHNTKETQAQYDQAQQNIHQLSQQIEKEKEISEHNDIIEQFKKDTEYIRNALKDIREKKDTLLQQVGRIEGEMMALEMSTQQEHTPISREAVADLYNKTTTQFQQANEGEYKNIIEHILTTIKGILAEAIDKPDEQALQQKKQELTTTKADLQKIEAEEGELLKKQAELQKEHEEKIQHTRTTEKRLLTLITEKNALEQQATELTYTLQTLKEDAENLKRELEEGYVLIGKEVEAYKTETGNQVLQEPREAQKEMRRTLERKKITLESMGAESDEETRKQYNELTERNEFLDKEKKDLNTSIQTLEETIELLQKDIDKKFQDGIKKISKEFETFFKILFGGGTARIEQSKREVRPRNAPEDEEVEMEIRIGVAIKLSLPHKKVNSLEQLSGGERALVSIALLFAISQVTPPPFLILDETDAALDEANSRRYGDMIEKLSEHSQLILITHNRETMQRAGALYGVTMNTSGASTLLSVQFDEAVKVAK